MFLKGCGGVEVTCLTRAGHVLGGSLYVRPAGPSALDEKAPPGGLAWASPGHPLC